MHLQIDTGSFASAVGMLRDTKIMAAMWATKAVMAGAPNERTKRTSDTCKPKLWRSGTPEK